MRPKKESNWFEKRVQEEWNDSSLFKRNLFKDFGEEQNTFISKAEKQTIVNNYFIKFKNEINFEQLNVANLLVFLVQNNII